MDGSRRAPPALPAPDGRGPAGTRKQAPHGVRLAERPGCRQQRDENGGGGGGVIVWILFAAGRPGSGSRSVCPTRMPAVRNTRPNVSV